MKSVFVRATSAFVILLSPNFAFSKDFAISVNAQPYNAAAQPSGGVPFAKLGKASKGQIPVRKFIQEVGFEDLSVSVPVAGSDQLSTEYNNLINTSIGSALPKFEIEVAELEGAAVNFVSTYNNVGISSMTLPALDAGNNQQRALINYQFAVRSANRTSNPSRPVKVEPFDNVLVSDFAFKVNSTDIRAIKISPIKVVINANGAEVENFKVIVLGGNSMTFLKSLQEAQYSNPKNNPLFANGEILFNSLNGITRFRANISDLGIVAIRDLSAAGEVNKFEVEFFATRVALSR